MTSELCESGDSAHWIVVQDCPRESEISREQSREDKEYVPREKNRIPRVPRHHKWTTGRSAVTLHR
jgi:hypothetical protein